MVVSNLLHVLKTPYIQAYMHLNEARHNKSRALRLIHYTLGLAEMIPGVNYLIYIVEVVVRKVINRLIGQSYKPITFSGEYMLSIIENESFFKDNFPFFYSIRLETKWREFLLKYKESTIAYLHTFNAQLGEEHQDIKDGILSMHTIVLQENSLLDKQTLSQWNAGIETLATFTGELENSYRLKEAALECQSKLILASLEFYNSLTETSAYDFLSATEDLDSYNKFLSDWEQKIKNVATLPDLAAFNELLLRQIKKDQPIITKIGYGFLGKLLSQNKKNILKKWILQEIHLRALIEIFKQLEKSYVGRYDHECLIRSLHELLAVIQFSPYDTDLYQDKLKNSRYAAFDQYTPLIELKVQLGVLLKCYKDSFEEYKNKLISDPNIR